MFSAMPAAPLNSSASAISSASRATGSPRDRLPPCGSGRSWPIRTPSIATASTVCQLAARRWRASARSCSPRCLREIREDRLRLRRSLEISCRLEMTSATPAPLLRPALRASTRPFRAERAAPRARTRPTPARAPAVEAGGRLERVQRGRPIARFTEREPRPFDRVRVVELPCAARARVPTGSGARASRRGLRPARPERLDPLGRASVLLGAPGRAESGRTRRR